MAGKKRTLQKLYEEFNTLKDRHEKEISQLQNVIEEQGKQIKMLEKLSKVKEAIDIPKNSKETVETVTFRKNLDDNNPRQLNCNMCEYKFRTFSELELHIKDKHVNFQAKCCDQCGKTFVTAWRLRKHMRIHSQVFTRTCKYFKSNTICPFEELGCKFNHDYVHMKGTVDVKDDTTKDNISDSSPSLNNSSLEKNGNTTLR